MIEQAQLLVSLIGIVLQLAGALLLGGLFLLLRRYSRRRRYFAVWGWAWLVLAFAVGSAAGAYLLTPAVSALAPVHFIYQFGKLTYLVLLVAGTAMYARGVQIAPFLPIALGISAAYALVSVYATADWRGVIAWQAPVAVLALGWCSARMFAMPRTPHSVGPRVAGVAFLLMAVVWAMYFPAFGALAGGGIVGSSAFDLMVRFNSYIDVLLHMILGSGMVVILMEEAKREVDDAHAELAVAHSDLRRTALHDALTGALNRRAFTEGLGLEMARAKFGAIMMVDLDDLKGVNDFYGHSAGDALLRHLSEVVRSELRPSDKLYRWGGDEFLLVLPAADELRAETRLRGVLSRAASLTFGTDEIRLSVSIGSAGYASADDMMTAIDRADALMYEEKNRRKFNRSSVGRASEQA